MKKYLERLRQSVLFQGMDDALILEALQDTDARVKKFRKQEYLFCEGERVADMGILLSGALHVIKDDFRANRTIVNRIDRGDLFGESVACSGAPSPFDVIAAEDSEAVLINYARLSAVSDCRPSVNIISKNLSVLFAAKNLILTKKINLLTQKTTREKLLAYLYSVSKEFKSPTFTIPFDRQELADYLSVERSAMSAQLSKLKEEGIIDYHKNSFAFKK